MIVKVHGRLVLLNPSKQKSAPSNNYGEYLKYGLIIGGVVALGLVGYAIYTGINNATKNGAVTACTAELQTLTTQYTTTYNSYLAANKGAALSQAQESNLSAIGTQMDSAQQCVVSAQGYGVAQAAQTITNIAVIAAAAIGASSAFGAYLKYKAGKYGSQNLNSTTEARAALRSAATQTKVDNGSITPEDGSAQLEQTNGVTVSEASAQTTSASSAAEDAASAAAAEGDSSLVEVIQTYIAEAIETIVEFVTAVYDAFYVLLA